MSDLTFREKGHVYMVDGEEVPSVSDLCRFISREVYKDAPPWKMEAAAVRGTAVHAAAQALDASGRCEIDAEYSSYIMAYRAFLGAHSVSWSLIEKPMYHPEHRYAGTIDRYGLIDGRAALVELKTTYAIMKPLVCAQTNLYRLLLIAKGLPVDRLYVLHLKKDGKYRLAPVEINERLAYALITLHNALKKKRRKRNV